jgi:hypothetical protein
VLLVGLDGSVAKVSGLGVEAEARVLGAVGLAGGAQARGRPRLLGAVGGPV